MRNKFIKFHSFIIAIITVTGSLIINVSAAEDVAINNSGSLSFNQSDYKNYDIYLKENDIKLYKGERIILDNNSVISENKEDIKIDDDILLWQTGKGSLSWDLSVREEAYYTIYIKYKPLKNESNIKFKMEIDGEIPFEGADSIEISSDWVNNGEIRKDKKGNEISPEQVKSDDFCERYFCDKTGVIIKPYMIALSSGEHTVKLIGLGFSFEIAELALVAPCEEKSYDEISKEYVFKEIDAESIIIQAENADIKSDNTLSPMATSGNAGMTPVDSTRIRVNYIGGSNWSLPGQKISWTFDVEASGYYKFGARYKQNELVNGESWRKLQIDGKTPFKEANELRFAFGTAWKHYEFKGNEDYYFYLEKGKHTLSLETTLGELSSFYDRLNRQVSKLGDLYLQIVMITGETPDMNRDYELFRQIPGFNNSLEKITVELKSLVVDMQKLSGEHGSQYTAAINNMIRVLIQMVEAPYIAHIYVKDYYTNYTTISSWLADMKKMPLALDEIRIVPYGKDFEWKEPNFVQRILFGTQRFIYSFCYDVFNPNDNRQSILHNRKMISCMKKMCVDIFKPKKDFSKRFTRSKVGNFFYMFFLLLAGLFTMLPLIYSILTSFKPIDELLIFPPRFFVKRPTISNYLVLPDLLSGLQIPFSRYIFNSIFAQIAIATCNSSQKSNDL